MDERLSIVAFKNKLRRYMKAKSLEELNEKRGTQVNRLKLVEKVGHARCRPPRHRRAHLTLCY
jgi:hypothetical protein